MPNYTPRLYDPIVDKSGKMSPAFFKWLIDVTSSISITTNINSVDEASFDKSSSKVSALKKDIEELKKEVINNNNNQVLSKINALSKRVDAIEQLLINNDNAKIYELLKRVKQLEDLQ